jgi:Cof subfamily protein (haloacid dehalogenase superfamily)
VRRILTIVSDLDGTLVPRVTFALAPRTVAAFRAAREAGARIIIASGRSGASMRPYAEELCGGLTAEDRYISCNGAQVCNGTGAVIRETAMPVEAVHAAVRWLRARGVYVQAYSSDGFVYDKECGYATAYAKSSGLRSVKVDDMIQFLDKPAIKLLGVDDPARVPSLIEQANEDLNGVVKFTTSEPQFLEISHPDVSKGNALRYLAGEMGFKPEDTLAFGDSLNDLTMLEWAGMSVATGNARKDVKRRADRVCGECGECGPAAVIESLLAEGWI